MSDLIFNPQDLVLGIAVVIGFVLVIAVSGWMMVIGLRSVGSIFGFEPTTKNTFPCGNCYHPMEKHWTGRKYIHPVYLSEYDEFGPCRTKSCPCHEWVSIAYASTRRINAMYDAMSRRDASRGD